MTPRQASDASVSQERRDTLGQIFFYLHIAIVAYIALGWLVPVFDLLIFYLVLLPAVTAQWQFNQDSCVLNNVESLIRTGRWRSADNAEEGAFLLQIVRRQTGFDVSREQMNMVIYMAMAVFWGLALGHLLWGS